MFWFILFLTVQFCISNKILNGLTNKTDYINEEIKILKRFNLDSKFIENIINIANENGKTIGEALKLQEERQNIKVSNGGKDWYSFNELNKSKISLENNTEWMKKIKDNVPTQLLSIPGSHDSCTNKFTVYWEIFKYIVEFFAKTQSWDLYSQLIAGIRFIDIRVSGDGNIYHGICQTNSNLNDVLEICSLFLKEHPSEGIFMRLSFQEGHCENKDCFQDNIISVLDKYINIFYLSKKLPNMGGLRGKIFLMPSFEYHNALNWGSSYINLQDLYDLNKIKDIETKIVLIKYYLDLSIERNKEFIINHISATGHKLGRSIIAMSETLNEVPFNFGDKYWCILPIDYPSEELVSKIIQNNFPINQK